MYRLIVVLFCVKCVICLLYLIVVPLPPDKNPFAVKINNSNNNNSSITLSLLPVFTVSILKEYSKGKGKAIPVIGREGPEVCETSRLPHFV
jgi:hypothetical protein